MIFDFIHNMYQNEIRIEESSVEGCLFLRAIKGNKLLGKLNALFETDNKALLADIDNKNCINRGVGSILFKRFEELCKEKGVTEIYGNLAYVDIGHKDRLIHFYKKHGYTIFEENDQSGYWGKIVKQL
ncbi:MAG: GNAT family N-acetyltransferase [Eubacterium sp.]|nr:GNAT family N-acetyltransferase [Eubacterium sp.]